MNERLSAINSERRTLSTIPRFLIKFILTLEVWVSIKYSVIFVCYTSLKQCADPDGWGGGRGSKSFLENHKNIGFLSKSGPDLLKITKLPNQHSVLGHHWHASERVSLEGR